MKFGQLIEYNIRNIFLGKSYTKCSEETIPRPFSKKSKIKPLDLWINTHKFYTVSFYCMLRWEPSKHLDQWPKNLYNLFLLYVKLRTIEIRWNFVETSFVFDEYSWVPNKRGEWHKRGVRKFLRGCWKILENLIANGGWRKFYLIH